MPAGNASHWKRLLRLSLVGRQLRTRFLATPPPPLPRGAQVLRRSRIANLGISFAYWRVGSRGHYRLIWSNAGTFDVDARRGIVHCHLIPRASPGAVEEILRGPVSSFFLLENGFEPLHAGGVVLDGASAVFIGVAGAGKSSLVAYLAGRGAGFLSDDLLPLRARGNSVRAHAGLPQVRLVRQAIRALGWTRRRAWRTRWKSTVPLKPASQRKAYRVSRLYLLERRARRKAGVVLKPLLPRKAFLALVSHTMDNSVDAPWRMHTQLRTFGWLAEHVPMRALVYPDGFRHLPKVRQVILEDLAR